MGYQKRQATGVVDMGVREYDRIYFSDRNRQCPVLVRGVAPLALKHSAVENDCVSVYAKDVTRSGYFSGCANESYFQLGLSFSDSVSLKKDGQAMLVL
jgi:hypothetical protein